MKFLTRLKLLFTHPRVIRDLEQRNRWQAGELADSRARNGILVRDLNTVHAHVERLGLENDVLRREVHTRVSEIGKTVEKTLDHEDAAAARLAQINRHYANLEGEQKFRAKVGLPVDEEVAAAVKDRGNMVIRSTGKAISHDPKPKPPEKK